MRCKPGDLAVVVRAADPRDLGRLVEVLYAAPVGVVFPLPDGYPSIVGQSGLWVLKAIGSPFVAPIESGRTRLAMFGVGADDRLRPIRPGDEPDETISWAGLPQKASA